VLKEIKFISFRRNEVSSKASRPTIATVNEGGLAPVYFADADRAQRNTVALRDVDYLIDAHFTMTDRAGPGDNAYKFIDMFSRRVQKGQHFHQPYFGCREFTAEVLPADDAPGPIDDTRDLGLMLWDIDYDDGRNTPVFFEARLEGGVLDVPADPHAAWVSELEREGGESE
ncbi:MAG: type I-E CRISPR-associated protein Cas5/CasD, partial [Planctomycetota bacterium]